MPYNNSMLQYFNSLLPPQPPSRLKIKNVQMLIKCLPDELKMKIYKEYLEPEIYYFLYKKILETEESYKLNICKLRPLIPILLSKQNVRQYICKKCDTFKTVYNIHKIENKKSFGKREKGDSFALSILFYIYH